MALTLCLFTLFYGAPPSLAAHATMPHAVMVTGCPDAGGHGNAGAARSDTAMSLACCIAHCLPALPGFPPFGAEMPAVRGTDATPFDEDGEGWAAPVLLPPPRA